MRKKVNSVNQSLLSVESDSVRRISIDKDFIDKIDDSRIVPTI